MIKAKKRKPKQGTESSECHLNTLRFIWIRDRKRERKCRKTAHPHQNSTQSEAKQFESGAKFNPPASLHPVWSREKLWPPTDDSAQSSVNPPGRWLPHRGPLGRHKPPAPRLLPPLLRPLPPSQVRPSPGGLNGGARDGALHYPQQRCRSVAYFSFI